MGSFATGGFVLALPHRASDDVQNATAEPASSSDDETQSSLRLKSTRYVPMSERPASAAFLQTGFQRASMLPGTLGQQNPAFLSRASQPRFSRMTLGTGPPVVPPTAHRDDRVARSQEQPSSSHGPSIDLPTASRERPPSASPFFSAPMLTLGSNGGAFSVRSSAFAKSPPQRDVEVEEEEDDSDNDDWQTQLKITDHDLDHFDDGEMVTSLSLLVSSVKQQPKSSSPSAASPSQRSAGKVTKAGSASFASPGSALSDISPAAPQPPTSARGMSTASRSTKVAGASPLPQKPGASAPPPRPRPDYADALRPPSARPKAPTSRGDAGGVAVSGSPLTSPMAPGRSEKQQPVAISETRADYADALRPPSARPRAPTATSRGDSGSASGSLLTSLMAPAKQPTVASSDVTKAARSSSGGSFTGASVQTPLPVGPPSSRPVGGGLGRDVIPSPVDRGDYRDALRPPSARGRSFTAMADSPVRPMTPQPPPANRPTTAAQGGRANSFSCK